MEAQQIETDESDDELTGLARSLSKGAFYDCEFEQLASNRAIIHLPENLRLSDVEDMTKYLRDHIEVTHIDATTLHVQTEHEQFN